MNNLVDFVYNLTQSGVKIPINQGFLYDTLSVVIAFMASLFPSWNPEPVTPIDRQLDGQEQPRVDGEQRPQVDPQQ